MLTKRQEITLYSVLHIPYSTEIYRLQDVDNMLVLAIQFGDTSRLAHVKIQQKLVEIASVPDLESDLRTNLDQWYDMFGDSTGMQAGGVGATTGVSFDLNAERAMIRERILAIVPFSKEYMDGELSRMQSQTLNVSVVR